MSAVAAPLDPSTDLDGFSLFYYDVVSADGTRVRAWTNDPDNQIDGPTVLLCNGLGTNPWCTPALLRPDCGVRVISWNHRGTGGSERPEDTDHVGIDAMVEDALAVMDHAELESATLMGWSIGVNTMFELAVRHPERVDALFAVGGVPGDTFSTMLRPLHLPRRVNRAITVGATGLMKHSAFLTDPIRARIHVGPRLIWAISHSGFMLPVADPVTAQRAIQQFLTTPFSWYFHLAQRTHGHQRISLSKVKVPTVFVAGRWDILAGAKDMRTAADRIEGAQYVELPASHFLTMEHPDRVHRLLLELVERVS